MYTIIRTQVGSKVTLREISWQRKDVVHSVDVGGDQILVFLFHSFILDNYISFHTLS